MSAAHAKIYSEKVTLYGEKDVVNAYLNGLKDDRQKSFSRLDCAGFAITSKNYDLSDGSQVITSIYVIDEKKNRPFMHKGSAVSIRIGSVNELNGLDERIKQGIESKLEEE